MSVCRHERGGGQAFPHLGNSNPAYKAVTADGFSAFSLAFSAPTVAATVVAALQLAETQLLWRLSLQLRLR